MQELERINEGEILFDVIRSRFNSVVDRLNELSKLRGDDNTIVIDYAEDWTIRCIMESFSGGGGGGKSSKYDGYFAVVDASETAEDGTRALKIRVVDGADSAAANCGYVRINNTGFEVAVFEKSVTTSSYLYLKSTLDTAQKPPVPGTPSFVLSPGRAGYEDESCYILIARIIVKDNTLRIIQEQHGEATGIIWGECEDETVS